MNNEYHSIERVFRLLFLLAGAIEDGDLRHEIYAQIPAYRQSDNCARMLERDLACLERLGFIVERTRHGRQGATYRIRNVEQVFHLAHHRAHEEMRSYTEAEIKHAHELMETGSTDITELVIQRLEDE